MEIRMPAAGGQPNSLRFAVLAGVANLVVCGAIGAALLLTTSKAATPAAAPRSEPSFSATVAPTSSSTTAGTTTTTATTAALDGLSQVSGPAGITTVIPTGWSPAPTTSSGSVQATDPADSTRFVRYGGSAAPATSILQSHLAAERDFSRQPARPGYARLKLDQTTVRGNEAVDWAFEWNAPEGRRHVHAVYWRANGTEYFVYASTKLTDWPQFSTVLTAMLANSTP
jgi:hypothetical protein